MTMPNFRDIKKYQNQILLLQYFTRLDLKTPPPLPLVKWGIDAMSYNTGQGLYVCLVPLTLTQGKQGYLNADLHLAGVFGKYTPRKSLHKGGWTNAPNKHILLSMKQICNDTNRGYPAKKAQSAMRKHGG